MQTWTGQELEIGDIVYRGAREGNGSCYRIGKVLGFSDAQYGYQGQHYTKVKVVWYYEDGLAGYFEGEPPNATYVRIPYPTKAGYSNGPMVSSVDIAGIIKIDPSVLGTIEDKILAILEEHGHKADHLPRLIKVWHKEPEYLKY